MKRTILFLPFLALFLLFSVNAVPNPASVYCHEQGYTSELRENEEGQYGVCIFPDGSECEEWQYYCKCMLNGTGCWSDNFSCDFPCQEYSCKKAGESSFVFGCCEGLKEITPIIAYDEECNEIGCTGCTSVCSDCGNNICEEWENKCNCPEDCKVMFDEKVLEALNESDEVPVIVKLYNRNMTKVNEILATLTEEEFKLDGKFPNGRGFYGNITQQGFDVLINNSDIKMIYLEGTSYIVDNNDEESEQKMIESNSETESLPELKNEEELWFHKIIQFIKSLFVPNK